MKPHHYLGIIALTPLLYSLSVGPVLTIDQIVNQPSLGIPSTGVLLFYRPLQLLCDRIPPAGRMMQSYVNFWLPR